MEKSICDLLQQTTVDKTVQKVTELNIEEFHLTILQFIVNCLKRKFVLDMDDLNRIDSNLVILIHRSEKINTDFSSLPIKLFFTKVFKAALEKNQVTATLICDCIVLLGNMTQSDNVPDDAVIKGISIYLLSLLSKPFIDVYLNRLSINENEDEDGLKESISSALDMINEQISDGILYQNLSRKIGLEFCETMNQHFEFLVSIEKNYLKTYKKFFEIDDATTQIMALGSLKNLCETTHNEIVNFFFEPEDDNFLQCIWTVLCQKNVNVSIAAYKLLSSISRLSQECDLFTDQQRCSIYYNIFSTNRNMSTECAKLMISFEKKFWLKFIHLINYYKSDFSGVENAIQILCKVNVADSDVDTIMEIIENNLEKPEISSCAAQIFFIMLDIIPFNHSDMIEKFNHLLQKCMNYDVIVLHLLSFYLKIDQEEIKSYYNNDNTSLNMIIQMLSQGFFECTSFFVMSQIMNVLYLFNNLFPNETSEMLKDLFEKLYSEFLEIIIEEDENDKLALSCCKLMVMCETNQLKDILENRHINTFCTVLKRHFKDNTKGIFIRFQTNILKHMWNKLARNDLMGLSPRLIVEIIRDIVVLLKLLLKNKQFDIFTSYMYITSLLDIYIYFQPSLAKHYPCLVFQKFQNQLNKEDFDSVAKFIEHYVFNTKCDEQSIIFKRKILQTWTSVVRQYMDSPTLISSMVILRHYNMKCELKNELNNLLDVIYNQEHNCFGKTIAYTIIKNSLEIDLALFKSFTLALDEFLLKKTDNDVKLKLSQIAYISSYVIQNLVQHFKENEGCTQKNGRMMVLDFLNHFIKPLSIVFKQKLEDFIPSDILRCGLDAKEKIKIEKFLVSLKRK